MEMKKVKDLFECFIEECQSNEGNRALFWSIKLKLLVVRLARELNIKIPLYPIHDSKSYDTFAFWNDTGILRKEGTSWCMGGVLNLCAEQYGDPTLVNDFLDYCQGDTHDILCNYWDIFSLENFAIAASISSSPNAYADWKKDEKELEEEQELYEQIPEAGAEDELFEETILETLCTELTGGLAYAFHRKFEEHLDYPNGLYGDIAMAAIEWVTEYFFGVYTELDDEFVHQMAYHFLGMMSRQDDSIFYDGRTLNCLFYIHPKGGAILKENEELLSIYKDMIAYTAHHNCEVDISSDGDMLSVGVAYCAGDDLNWISIATYLFLQTIDAIYKQQLSTEEKIPA